MARDSPAAPARTGKGRDATGTGADFYKPTQRRYEAGIDHAAPLTAQDQTRVVDVICRGIERDPQLG